MPVDRPFGFGDLLINPAQRAPGPIVAERVVNDTVRDATGLLPTGGWPRLGQHQPVGDRLVGVLIAPLADHIGQIRVKRPGCDGGSGYWISTRGWSVRSVA